MAPLGRAEANKLAGEKIPFLNDKKAIADIPNVLAHDVVPVAPLFNLVRGNYIAYISILSVLAGR